MLFLFGPSIPKSLSRYFSARAARDGHKVIFASMGQFASTEAFSELRGFDEGDLKGQPVVVFQSLARVGDASANDHFTQLFFTGGTLKQYGAGPLWAVTPFGPYARQDQERPGKMDSVGCDFACRALSLYFSGLSAIEAHSKKALNLMKANFGEGNAFSIDPTKAFLEDLQGLNLRDPVVISPDKGANARADELAQRLGADRFYIDKKRTEIVNVSIEGSRGDVSGRDAVMVDDMADSLGTAAQAAEFVHEKGAAGQYIYMAHPVLSGEAWNRLAKLAKNGSVDRVRFGDTIARGAEMEKFEQQYGQEIADKVGFLDMGERVYRHVTETVAGHPAMKIG